VRSRKARARTGSSAVRPVVETDIHHSTDNTLLWDVVRVLTRLLGRCRGAGTPPHRRFS
jgi:hypothetical protein